MVMLAGAMLVVAGDQPAFAQPVLSEASTPVVLPEKITNDYDLWVERISELRSSLEKNQGFLRLKGDLVDVLVFDRESGKKLLMTRYESSLESSAVVLPDDFFVRLDGELDALWLEIERLAPGYSLPQGTTPRSANVATVIGRRLKGIAPDAEIVNTVTLEEKMAYGANSAGAAVSRRSKGLVLYRVPGLRWAICREFVVEKPVAGSGATANNYDVRFGSVRMQLAQAE